MLLVGTCILGPFNRLQTRLPRMFIHHPGLVQNWKVCGWSKLNSGIRVIITMLLNVERSFVIVDTGGSDVFSTATHCSPVLDRWELFVSPATSVWLLHCHMLGIRRRHVSREKQLIRRLGNQCKCLLFPFGLSSLEIRSSEAQVSRTPHHRASPPLSSTKPTTRAYFMLMTTT